MTRTISDREPLGRIFVEASRAYEGRVIPKSWWWWCEVCDIGSPTLDSGIIETWRKAFDDAWSHRLQHRMWLRR